MTSQITPVSDGQIAQVKTLVEAAVRKSGLDKDGLQLVIANGDGLQGRLVPILQELGGAGPNPYEDERTKQSYYYPPKGWTVPSFSEQLQRLGNLLPGLTLPTQAPEIAVPKGFDSFAIVPKVSALGRIFSIQDPYGAGYGQVVEQLLGLIDKQRKFYNCRKGELGPNYIRIEKRVRGRLQMTESKAGGDCLVVPISFGNLYAGYSPRNARETALRAQQLPFITVQVASLLLVMPERLVSYDDLWIDVPGDQYDWLADGDWSNSLCFDFIDVRLRFHASDAVYADGRYGSAVAFLGV